MKQEQQAIQQAELAWGDVMTALGAVGIGIPIDLQDVAKKALVDKKLKDISRKEEAYQLEDKRQLTPSLTQSPYQQPTQVKN